MFRGTSTNFMLTKPKCRTQNIWILMREDLGEDTEFYGRFMYDPNKWEGQERWRDLVIVS